MTDRLELNTVEQALLAKAAECREVLQNTRQSLSVETPLETMDRQVHAADCEAALERAQTTGRLLRQTEAALSRIKNHTYGVCLKCEDEIGSKRLRALPWAMFCLDCQRSVDVLHEAARQARRQELRQAA